MTVWLLLCHAPHHDMAPASPFSLPLPAACNALVAVVHISHYNTLYSTHADAGAPANKNERTQQTSPNRVACKAIKAKGREEKNSASPQVLLKNEIFIGQRAAPAIWLCSSPLQGASESACARPFW